LIGAVEIRILKRAPSSVGITVVAEKLQVAFAGMPVQVNDTGCMNPLLPIKVPCNCADCPEVSATVFAGVDEIGTVSVNSAEITSVRLAAVVAA
jgi:hypothetical protein